MILERSIIALAFVCTGCAFWAQAQQVETGYDESFPLAELKTFNFFQQ